MCSETPKSSLSSLVVRPIKSEEACQFKALLAEHHYLGASPKIGETLWYVATCRDSWAALLTFLAAALKSAAKDQWIGWDYRHRYGRLKLLANNSRFFYPPWLEPAQSWLPRPCVVCEAHIFRLGKNDLGTPSCFWKLSLIQDVTEGQFTVQPIGSIWDKQGDLNEQERATAQPLSRRNSFLSCPCRPMPGHCCQPQPSHHLIV